MYLTYIVFVLFFLSYIANAWCLIWTKQQLLLLARVAIFVFELGLEIHQECSNNEDNDDEHHRNDNGRPRSSSFRQPPNLLRWLNFWKCILNDWPYILGCYNSTTYTYFPLQASFLKRWYILKKDKLVHCKYIQWKLGPKWSTTPITAMGRLQRLPLSII